jgi:hypothetical protein
MTKTRPIVRIIIITEEVSAVEETEEQALYSEEAERLLYINRSITSIARSAAGL